MRWTHSPLSIFSPTKWEKKIPRTERTWSPSRVGSWCARGNIKKSPQKKSSSKQTIGDPRGWWLLALNRDRFCVSSEGIDKNREPFRSEKAQRTIMEPIMFMLGWSAKEVDPNWFLVKKQNNARKAKEKCSREQNIMQLSEAVENPPTSTHCPRSTEFQFREWLLIYCSCKAGEWRMASQKSTRI